MNQRIVFFLFSIIFFGACEKSASEQNIEKNTSSDVKKIFEEKTVMEFLLQMNFDEILIDIGKDRAWHDAILTWNQKNIKVKVKTRGNFRRDPDNCNFPPLFIAFDSASSVDTPFENTKKLRLVTHCQKDIEEYEQIVLEEYNIYQNYTLFTDKSVRTRLCQITYEDTKKSENQFNKKEPYQRLAFFVEDTKHSAKRLGIAQIKAKDTVEYLECNSFLATQFAVFQFMVGNTDWSVSYKHNLSILEVSSENYAPIPYDFDFSGLIDAPYATPDPNLGTESVTERVYWGYCQSEAELYLVLNKFKNKEKEVIQIWQDLPFHTPERKAKCIAYIKSFYDIIQHKDSVHYYFLEGCR